MSLTKATYSMIEGAPVNVPDYGADPTGIANSTTAIQAALNGQGSIYIPDGVYKITADLIIKLN
jgi:polygalacturonase